MSHKKAIPLDLTSVVVGVYDHTKTFVSGRAAKKVLTGIQGGKTVVGSPLNSYNDSLNDALPTGFTPVRNCVSNNGHKLEFNSSTAAGLVICALYDVNEATGVHTYVGKIQFQLPNTTHTQRGARLVNDSGATGWRIIVTTLGNVAASGGLFSIENVAKTDFVAGTPTNFPVASAPGQKAVYWHQETGGTNNLTVAQGLAHDHDTGSLVTQKVYVPNGLVATPNFYVFDSSVAITTVGALGVTTDWYTTAKTGVITGMAGTFLLLNNYSICIPDATSGAPVALQGATCLFIPTSSNMGLVNVTDLSAGATTLPSYATRDVNDVANTNTTQTPLSMHFSQVLQRIVFQMNAGKWAVKQFVNAQYETIFGNSNDSQYRALQPIPFFEFGGATVTSTYEHAGWLYCVNGTVGQTGGNTFDLRSLWQYDYSSIISKVISVPNMSFIGLSVLTPIRSFGKFWYRLSGFGSAAGGWIAIPEDRDMSAIANSSGQIQLKFQTLMERDSVTVPIQIIEAHLMVDDLQQNSDNWLISKELSSTGGTHKVVGYLQTAYASGVVPTLYARAFQVGTSTSVGSNNTVSTPSAFRYSTNGGTSWNALGTIPNVVGTLVEWTITPAPTVDYVPSFKE